MAMNGTDPSNSIGYLSNKGCFCKNYPLFVHQLLLWFNQVGLFATLTVLRSYTVTQCN